MTPTTRTKTFRHTDSTAEELDQLGEHWQANETESMAMAIRLAYEANGLARDDAVGGIEEVEREHGSDAVMDATVADGEADTNAILTINGERLEGWTAGMIAVGFTAGGKPVEVVGHDGPLAGTGTMHVRHDASGSFFAFGEIENPKLGSQVSVRVGDLVERLVLRSEGKNPQQLRRSIRRDLALRRKVRAAMGDTDPET